MITDATIVSAIAAWVSHNVGTEMNVFDSLGMRAEARGFMGH